MKVYSVNLENRKDRRSHIISQFDRHQEFSLEVVSAIKHDFGAIGLWKTLVSLIQDRIDQNEEYFIFCEDDHQFMENYSHNQLLEFIEKAKSVNADVLLGGISWFDIAVQYCPNLFWVNSFTGAQFMILFRTMYSRIVEVDNFSETDALDRKISALTSNIFVIYPFISIQKEFGYSDVTESNNIPGRVEHLFKNTSKKLNLIEKVHDFIQAVENQDDLLCYLL